MTTTTKGTKLQCMRCQHTWLQRGPEPPRSCPRCKSYEWQRSLIAVAKAVQS